MKETVEIKSIEQIKKENPPPKVFLTKEKAQQVQEALKQTKNEKEGKKFNWPWSKKSVLNKSVKEKDTIIVFMVTSKKTLDIIPTKIYSGNFLVIKNRVYEFDPSKVLTMGKWKLVVARDYDRKCVGVDDYQELLLKDINSNNPGGRINTSDPVLIKAIIQAHLSEKQNPLTNKKWIWIVVIILVVIIGFFFIFGNKK